MSDLNRLDDETTTDAPPAREGSFELESRGSEHSASGPRASESGSGEPTVDPTATAGPAGAAGTDGEAPRKKRRRGTRGGQRRKKPAGAGSPGGGGARAAGGGAATARVSASEGDDNGDDDGDGYDDGHGDGHGDGDDRESMSGSEDWTAESADRGLTDDDIAEQAREDAGLSRAPSPSRPKIGDSRPAPAAPAAEGEPAGNGETGPDGAPKKRRRRRGGRGRSKGGTGGAAGTGGAGAGPRRPRLPVARGAAGRAGVRSSTSTRASWVTSTSTGPRCSTRSTKRRCSAGGGRAAKAVRPVATSWSCTCAPTGIAHIGVLEGRQLIEHYVSTPTDDNTSIDGNIYLGRVQNVLPGMEAAFIDIGTPKNGVLYRGDVAYDANDVEGGEKPRIERVLHNGQAIIVQVTKNPIAHKGARLTQEVSLAGRFVVMVPGQPQTYGISKRLPDDERKRLRRVLDRLRPADAGLIVRTAAEGATEEELERDMLRLNAQWQQISTIAKKAKPGSLLYKEPQLAIRLIREEFTKEFRGVVIDNAAMYEEVKSYIDAIAPELAERVEFYDAEAENLPVFEKFHVHEQLHKALDRKVWLPSGGSLVIERTEALTVIDVNTGKNVGTSNLEETVYRNNLEAAEVVARELRLRDIGGIIVIDFIDMEIKRNREAVEDAFRQALARDKTRTQIFPISELGLVEMTRKRVSEGLVEAFSSTCPHCNGRGFVVDESLFE